MSNPYLFCQGQMAGKCGGVTRKKERKKKKKKEKQQDKKKKKNTKEKVSGVMNG